VPPIECSRALLFPGPQPPLSHFGATLLRHTLATGLRYALHGLGLPMPERPPVRIVRLRVYLDPAKLLAQLEAGAASEQVVEALVDPAGTGDLPSEAAALRGALAFHRARLRLPRRQGRGGERVEPGLPAAEIWPAFRAELSRQQRVLNDALLGELIASLGRRAKRHQEREVLRCLGREAHRLRSGRRADLSSLGAPDAMVPSWEETPRATEIVSELLAQRQVPPLDRLRGGFREAYRRMLSTTRESYLSLATSAYERGVLETPGDAFFIPFDLAEDLTAETRPGWLAGAVASNRLEYQGLLETGGPPESIAPGESKRVIDDVDRWVLGPVCSLE
jgi:hypothetical protein